MRTTLSIDDRLLEEAKRVGTRTGRSLAKVVEDALREVLARRRSERSAEPTRLLTVGKGGVQPGVDLDDSAGLYDIMERD